MKSPIIFSLLPKINPFSNLERMVVTRAIGTTFMSKFSSEWSFERFVLDFSNIHTVNVWCVSISVLYIMLYLNKYNKDQTRKFENIEIYEEWSKNINKALFILFLVLTREIENAI